MLTDGVRGVLYDLDGVLIDSAQAWYRVIQRGLAELGRPPTNWERFRRSFGQGVEADRQEFFPEWSAAAVETFYARAFGDELAAVQVLPGAREALREGRRRGLRQALVTNTPLALARRVLAVHELGADLDALACAGEAAEKPSPELVWLALGRLELTAAEVLYVGDSPTDAAAARTAGVRLVGVGGLPGDVTLGSIAELF